MKIEFNEEEVLLLLAGVIMLLDNCGLGEMEYIKPLENIMEKLNNTLEK